jgi:hypothetical protein
MLAISNDLQVSIETLITLQALQAQSNSLTSFADRLCQRANVKSLKKAWVKLYAGSLPNRQQTNFNCFLIRFQIVTQKYVSDFISIYLNKYEFEIIIFSLDDSTRKASFMARGCVYKKKSQIEQQ